MIKPCENCQTEFETFDARMKSCSATCANALRKRNARRRVVPLTPTDAAVMTLPPPEELPAPYAKRVHDMWVSLTSGTGLPTRIA